MQSHTEKEYESLLCITEAHRGMEDNTRLVRFVAAEIKGTTF